MSDHPSNAEKMRHLTDSHLERILTIVRDQYAKEPSEQRGRVVRMYETETRRRKQARVAHDLARNGGDDE